MCKTDMNKILSAMDVIRDMKGITLIIQFLDPGQKKIVQDGISIMDKWGLKFICIRK